MTSKPTTHDPILTAMAQEAVDGAKMAPEQSTPGTIPITTLQTKRETLITARDQLRLQLNGVENQIFLIDQFLNPEVIPNDQAPPEVEERPPLEKGTI